MEGDYLELSKFSYSSPIISINPRQEPLVSGFLIYPILKTFYLLVSWRKKNYWKQKFKSSPPWSHPNNNQKTNYIGLEPQMLVELGIQCIECEVVNTSCNPSVLSSAFSIIRRVKMWKHRKWGSDEK